jgi:hypothetical protein
LGRVVLIHGRDVRVRWAALTLSVSTSVVLSGIGIGPAAAVEPRLNDSSPESNVDQARVVDSAKVTRVNLSGRSLVVRVRWNPVLRGREGPTHAYGVAAGVRDRVFAVVRDVDLSPDPFRARYRINLSERQAGAVRRAASGGHGKAWITTTQQYDSPADSDRLFEVSEVRVSSLHPAAGAPATTAARATVTGIVATGNSAVEIGPGANVIDQNLRGADLRLADLTRVAITGSNLIDAKLDSALLEHTTISGSNLTWASLQHARLGRVRISDSELIGAELNAAVFHSVLIERSNLRGASFENARFDDTRLKRVSIGHNRVYGAKLRVSTGPAAGSWVDLRRINALVSRF